MRALAILLFCFGLSGAGGAQELGTGQLGSDVQDVTKEEANALGWESPHGARVIKLMPGGPAEKAGLLPDDILLSADGMEIEDMAGFTATVNAKAPGTEIKLRLLRGGKEKLLAVTLGTGPVRPPRAELKDAPLLQLDTGGHTAMIRSLAFTPDSNFIVSAGDDKVIRVWDWRAGKTVRILRGQSGPGQYGKLYTLAISPDGRWLAAGGWADALCPGRCGDIRLYDFASGELKTLLRGHSDTIKGLAFSHDGKQLISASWDKSAIVWDVETQELLHRLSGHTGAVMAAAFTPDGLRAVTASLDKTLRLWNVADGALIEEMTGHADRVQGLAVSPKDGSIASGDVSGEIRLWDGGTGAFIKVLAKQKAEAASLTFSPDGRLLLSGEGYCAGSCSFTQHIFGVLDGRELATHSGHGNSVYAAAFAPDGGLAATGGFNGDIRLWAAATGKTAAVLRGTGRQVWNVGFAAEGRNIAWGNSYSGLKYPDGVNKRGPLEISLRLPGNGEMLSEPQPVDNLEGWASARDSFGPLSLRLRMGARTGRYPILDLLNEGQPSGVSIELNAMDGVQHRSFTFSPDGRQIVSGGNAGMLWVYGLDGNKLGKFVGHESDVSALAVSPDGRCLVSGSGDQTVRLWNLQTRGLLVSLFRGVDGEWVMWTPQGYYTGSPGADKMVGWQINMGADKAASYVTAEQLRKHLYRPDIVAKAIELASAEEAVRTSYGTGTGLADLLARPAPRLRILSPAPGSTVNAASSIPVKVALDPTPDPVTRIRIQINGRQLGDYLPQNGPAFEPGEYTFNAPLAKGRNMVAVTALNAAGWSRAQDGTLSVANQSAGALDKRGVLYLIAIGVSKYPGIASLCKPKPNCDLAYTGADALAFASAVETKLGALHEKVVRRVLVNEDNSDGKPTATNITKPTAANIINALGLLSRAAPNDTVAVFLAGHGMNDGPNYRFIPTDAALSRGAIKPATVVPWYAIEEAIDGAKGRRLLFIDTCHAAGAYNERLGNAAYYANILAYSSARWDQEALESDEFKHGLFTQALVEGLGGAADRTRSGRVDTVQLNNYLQIRVPELAKPFLREQNPQFFKGRDAEVYPLAAY